MSSTNIKRKIGDIYTEAARTGRPVFSFEFFPPKNEKGEAQLYATLEELRAHHPDFVSVTYGAGGSTRDRTLEWVRAIQDRFGMLAMAHYTCIGSSRVDVEKMLSDLYSAGIRNIMSLRGDMPADNPDYQPPADGFFYANELIAFIRETRPDFCLGGACYPEKHQEAPSPDVDLRNLKRKVDAGAEFLVSQLFFLNERYFDFVKRCRDIGIEVPIVPGIMPITNFKQIERFTTMAGCEMPGGLVKELGKVAEDKEALQRISLEFSIKQCRELLDGGAPGIHFYTLNQSYATMHILDALR
ncbi:MAG: methylenetetrahydrofolate reductase [NAD(P)H] [Leptospiraceae bacterium]|nr:methylenetetrahydrofolate reductase [NAD(P)H] [Leptospiraceae bacterium]MCB1315354.1 methylenetetrahydrofolate reductase [NAD(P)H] [Leptospiraceae bacterium]